MAVEPASLRLAHRGVVLLDAALLPALVPDGWTDVEPAGGVRLVQVGGHEAGTRPFLLAPTQDPVSAASGLASHGAAAFILVGPCSSPTRALEPGDVLVPAQVRGPAGSLEAHAAMARKLANRCEHRGLPPRLGALASAGAQAEQGDLAQDHDTLFALEAAARAGVPAGALLVCTGNDPAGGAEAPAAVLESFDRVFGVVQEILGSVRKPTAPDEGPAA
jgi:hypothetical protein